MSLDTPWQIEQTWGSNQAVLKGVVEGLHPHSALECGCGYFSTPILRGGVPLLMTIEHDRAWVKKIQKDFPPSDSHWYYSLEFPGLVNGTAHADVASDIKQHLDRFYREAFLDYAPYGFVLIDTFRCARVSAALALAPRTGLMMLHDVRPSSRDFYRYHELDETFKDWHRYEHRPQGMINKAHIIPWTALYSREPLDLDALQGPIIKESERLWDQSVGLEEIHG